MSGSSCFAHATIPPCRCIASENPAFLTAASDLGGPHTGLAVQHQRAVVRQLDQTLAGLDRRLRNQLGALDAVDVPLDGFAHVDQREFLAGVQQLTKLTGVMVESAAASAAASDTTPQNAS